MVDRLVAVDDADYRLPEPVQDVLDETFVAKGDWINLADYTGAAFDGVANNDAQLIAAADDARATKARLWVPNILRVRLNTVVNLRYFDVQFDGFLTVDPAGGVIVGDSSNVRVGRSISFKSALHVNSSTQTNPVVRVQGLMGGDVEIGRCDFLQLYANETEEPGTGDANAYSTYRLTGGVIRHLELLGEGGQSWNNQNLFLGGDIKKLTIRGTYTANSNTWVGTSFEGADSLIDIQRGSRNKFRDVRGEYGPKIKFGTQTWQNVLVDGFTSNALARTTGFVVEEDLGTENVVVASIDQFLEPHTVFRLDSQTKVFDTAAPYPGTPVRPGLHKLKVNTSFQTVVRTGPVAITAGTARIRRFEGSSDATLWRPRVRGLDENFAPIDPTSTPFMDTTGGWSAVGGADPYYQYGAARDAWAILPINPAVKYLDIEIQSSGSTAGLPFERMSMTAFRHGRDSEGLIDMWKRAFSAPLYGGIPTTGRGWRGLSFENSTNRTVCTAVAKTSLTAGAASSATVLTVASTTGMLATDVIGVLLTDGTTHWGAVSSVDSGTQVTISPALTGAASSGGFVETVRWAVR